MESFVKDSSSYTFRITANNKWIVIDNGSTEEPFQVVTLRRIVKNVSGFYSTPVVDMAREALEAFGLQEEEEGEILTDTISKILGIKFYQEIGPLRRFVAWMGKKEIRKKTISELETEIRGE